MSKIYPNKRIFYKQCINKKKTLKGKIEKLIKGINLYEGAKGY